MCGIVYAKNLNKQPVNEWVQRQFNSQRSRGTKGFGFFDVDNNKLVHNTREHRILNLMKRSQTSDLLFHHRMPTSTPNVRNSCHPFSTHNRFTNQFIVVHNGMISNDRELKAKHEQLGIKYVSLMASGRFNDTEAFVWELGRYLSGEVEELDVQGSIAFIAVELSAGKPSFLHFGSRHGTNLRFKHTSDELLIASELTTLDEETHHCEAGKLYSFSYTSGRLVETDLKWKANIYTNTWGFSRPRQTQAPIQPEIPFPQYVDFGGTVRENEEIRILIEAGDDGDAAMVKLIDMEQKAINHRIKQLQDRTLIMQNTHEVLRFLRKRSAALGHVKKRVRKKRLMTAEEINAITEGRKAALQLGAGST